MRCRVFVMIAVTFLICAAAGAAHAQTDDAAPATEETEPVNLNAASLEDLMALPGMDDDLARAILAVRDSLGRIDAIVDLYRNPAITPARLLEILPLLLIDRERGPTSVEMQGTVRSTSSSPRTDVRTVFRTPGPSAALRLRRQEPDAIQWTARAESPLPGGIRMIAGDQAPVEGLGLLTGVSSRPPPTGVLAPAGRGSLLPPVSGGRVLRGVHLTRSGFISAGVFDFEGEPVVMLRLNPGAATGGHGVSPAAIRAMGRLWSGLILAGGNARVEWTLDVARDPYNLWRYAGVLAGRGSAIRVYISTIGGATRFTNPFGIDFESGRNDNRNETALKLRSRLARGLALEVEARGAVEGATTRRAWDRATGFGRARLEASLGSGWSLLAETRVENKSAPGPTDIAEAPLRRHSGVLRAGWERARNHLRLEWQGKLDFRVPRDPAEPSVIDAVADVVQARGRFAVNRRIAMAGGLSRFRTPSAAPATIYEERPTGLYPAVLVRGTGRRVHAAVEVAFGGLSGGFFMAREEAADGPVKKSWGVSIRLLKTGGQPLAAIDSKPLR